VAGHGLEALKGGAPSTAFSRISVAASGRTVQSSFASWSTAVGSATPLPSRVGNTRTPLVRGVGTGERDAVEDRPVGQLEDEKLALSGVALE